MSISDFFSSIFGKTNKRKRHLNKKNSKTRQNKKHTVRFMKGVMKGGWGGGGITDTHVHAMKGGMKGGMKGVMKGVMKGGMKGVMKGGSWGGAMPLV